MRRGAAGLVDRVRHRDPGSRGRAAPGGEHPEGRESDPHLRPRRYRRDRRTALGGTNRPRHRHRSATPTGSRAPRSPGCCTRPSSARPGAPQRGLTASCVRLPGPLRRTAIRLAATRPSVAATFGPAVGVTSLGMFTRGWGWAIPLAPLTVIVTVGGVVDRPVVRDGQIVARPMLPLTLSFDHAVIDGAPAARFTETLRAPGRVGRGVRGDRGAVRSLTGASCVRTRVGRASTRPRQSKYVPWRVSGPHPCDSAASIERRPATLVAEVVLVAHNAELGRRGEQLAVDHLEARGMHVVARNWRCRRGEIDIVARDGGTRLHRGEDPHVARVRASIRGDHPGQARPMRRLASPGARRRMRGAALRIDAVAVIAPAEAPARSSTSRGSADARRSHPRRRAARPHGLRRRGRGRPLLRSRVRAHRAARRRPRRGARARAIGRCQRRMPASARKLTVNLSPAALPKHGSGFDLAIAVAASRPPARCPWIGRSGRAPGRTGTRRAAPADRRDPARGARRGASGHRHGDRSHGERGGGGARAGSRWSAWRRCSKRRSGTAVNTTTNPSSRCPPSCAPRAPMRPRSATSPTSWATTTPSMRCSRGRRRPPPVPARTARRGQDDARVAAARHPARPRRGCRLEVSSIRSLAGSRSGRAHHTPAVEAPHHTATAAAIVGGGSRLIRPGAAARASHGVLFLDEAPEFPAAVLDALRQPLESGIIRVHGHAVACPGRFRSSSPRTRARAAGTAWRRRLHVSTRDTAPVLARVSGPLLDRIDLQVSGAAHHDRRLRMHQQSRGMSSAERVCQGRRRARRRGGTAPRHAVAYQRRDARAVDARRGRLHPGGRASAAADRRSNAAASPCAATTAS